MRVNQPIQPIQLKGVIPALATLMDRRGNIDYVKQNMLIEDLIKESDALVVMGTTGQAATFDYQEHIDEVKRTFEFVGGRIPIIVGAGSNDTAKAIDLAQRIEEAIGPTTFLEATGYYVKSTPESAFQHFAEIARNIRGNMVLYNVPGRTEGLDLKEWPVLALHREFPDKIIGLKQADPSKGVEYTKTLVKNTSREKFNVVSGEDDKVIDIMNAGGTGVISASANCCPGLFRSMVDAYNEGNVPLAEVHQEQAMPYIRFCFSKPGNNPTNLAYLFGSGVRGANLTLEESLKIAKRISRVSASDEWRGRVNAWEHLMNEGERLVIANDPLLSGVDLWSYKHESH